MEMYSVEFYRITRKQKKKIQQQNVTPVGVEYRAPTFMSCMLLSELFAGSLGPLEIFGINRAWWLYKDEKSCSMDSWT